jgi:hypothetical protein
MSHGSLISLLVAISLPLWLVLEQVVAWKLFRSEAAQRPSRGHLQVSRGPDLVDNSTGSVAQRQAA